LRYILGSGRFWYDFIVSDDWTVALGVVIALVAAVVVARADLSLWWLMPVAVAGLSTVTVQRVARWGRPAH
jgi:hypothetical protein